MSRFVRIRPAEQVGDDRGVRLRVEREDEELTEIVEEKTLPERVRNPDANHVELLERLWLTEQDVRWLHHVLGELVFDMDIKARATPGDTPRSTPG
jgi:hypothetical protein